MNHGVPPQTRCCISALFIILYFSNMDSKTVPATEKAVGTSASNSVEYVEAQGFDEKATKKMIRRIDWHLIPFLSLIYL